MKIADIAVDCIDVMGTDLSVVNAARVSFHKESEWRQKVVPDEDNVRLINVLSDKDKKLIKYLADHNHWSPFSHCFMSFRIKAPMFVARQLGKHQVGLSWNEVSRRYVDYEPEFFFPKAWRKRAENVKQGSSDESVDFSFAYDYSAEGIARLALECYTDFIRQGVCPEQARMVLPQNTMTEWIWSGSLYAFARVCNLRLDSHTQAETRDVAKLIYDYMKDAFPVSTEVLVAT